MIINKINGIKRGNNGDLTLYYQNCARNTKEEVIINKSNCNAVVNNIEIARFKLANTGSIKLIEGIVKLYNLNKMNKCMAIIEDEIVKEGWSKVKR